MIRKEKKKGPSSLFIIHSFIFSSFFFILFVHSSFAFWWPLFIGSIFSPGLVFWPLTLAQKERKRKKGVRHHAETCLSHTRPVGPSLNRARYTIKRQRKKGDFVSASAHTYMYSPWQLYSIVHIVYTLDTFPFLPLAFFFLFSFSFLIHSLIDALAHSILFIYFSYLFSLRVPPF